MNECRVTQLCLTLCDCSLPGSSFLGILQPRILEWDPTPWDLPTQGSNLCLLCLPRWQDSLPLAEVGIYEVEINRVEAAFLK